jgi:hypothetical protein
VTSYDGEAFEAPLELRNGSANLQEVYAWANSILGTSPHSVTATNYPLETIHADLFQTGGDDLFVAQPDWGGTGGNLYFAFAQTRKGYRFAGDIWFGNFETGRGKPVTKDTLQLVFGESAHANRP